MVGVDHCIYGRGGKVQGFFSYCMSQVDGGTEDRVQKTREDPVLSSNVLNDVRGMKRRQ